MSPTKMLIYILLCLDIFWRKHNFWVNYIHILSNPGCMTFLTQRNRREEVNVDCWAGRTPHRPPHNRKGLNYTHFVTCPCLRGLCRCSPKFITLILCTCLLLPGHVYLCRYLIPRPINRTTLPGLFFWALEVFSTFGQAISHCLQFTAKLS